MACEGRSARGSGDDLVQARYELERAGAVGVAEEEVGELASLQRPGVAPYLVLGLDVEAGLEVRVDPPFSPLGAVDPQHAARDPVGLAVLHVEEPPVVGLVGRAAVVDVVAAGVRDPRPVLHEPFVLGRGRRRVRFDPELLDREGQRRRVLGSLLGPVVGGGGAGEGEGARALGHDLLPRLVVRVGGVEPPVEDERGDLVVGAQGAFARHCRDEGGGDARVLGARRGQAVAHRDPVLEGAFRLSVFDEGPSPFVGIGAALQDPDRQQRQDAQSRPDAHRMVTPADSSKRTSRYQLPLVRSPPPLYRPIPALAVSSETSRLARPCTPIPPRKTTCDPAFW